MIQDELLSAQVALFSALADPTDADFEIASPEGTDACDQNIRGARKVAESDLPSSQLPKDLRVCDGKEAGSNGNLSDCRS